MKITHILFASATTLVLISCGNSTDTANDSNLETDSVNTENIIELESTKEFAGVTELANKTEFTVKELNDATVFLYRKEGILVGYPSAYPNDTSVTFTGRNGAMIDATDINTKKASVSIQFKDEIGEKIMQTKKLFAIKGKLNISYYVSDKWNNETKISIYDAEFLTDENTKYKELSSLDNINLSKPIFCGDLFTLLNTQYETIYNNDKISITGIYNGTTTSKDADGNILETRVDLSDKNIGLGSVVGCAMEGIPDDNILKDSQDNKKAITIEGKFNGGSDKAKIKNAVIK